GGTGRLRDIWPAGSTYVCLDNDPRKLGRFRSQETDGSALVADARQLPFPDHTVDVIMSVAMSHHLPDDVLDGFLAEADRVLRPSGAFIFFDAVVRPKRWLSRLLWRYDRGAFPRFADDIEARLNNHFHLGHREEYTWAHHYVIWVGHPVETVSTTAA